EEVERGPVVGPDGGTIETPAGIELTIPEGALTAKVPVAATLLSPSELAALPAVAGYDTLAAVRIELAGATPAPPATLSLPPPAPSRRPARRPPGEPAAPPRPVPAERPGARAGGRGAVGGVPWRPRRDGTGDAERVVAAPELAGTLPLDGIVREDVYLLLAAH